MQRHSELLQFEEAERYKKRLDSIISLEDETSINIHPLDIDIWHENSQWVKMIFYKDGSTIEYYLKDFDINE